MQLYLTRPDLKHKNKENWPNWLKEADTVDADIRIENKKIIWENGIWLNGVWAGDEWVNGIWVDGLWNGGSWDNGIWMNGNMLHSLWVDGIWMNGISENVTFEKGLWKNGTGMSGSLFNDIEIEKGTFHDKNISHELYKKLNRTIKRPSLKDTPKWLQMAQTTNALFEIINGDVVWHHGDWLFGVWKNGTWENGKASEINWQNGTWKNGYWKNGVFRDGIWESGYWKDGVWLKGMWKSGIFHSGAKESFQKPDIQKAWNISISEISNKLTESQKIRADEILASSGGSFRL